VITLWRNVSAFDTASQLPPGDKMTKNNPYIGPRPYERQDAHNFYGRTREARDLLSLIRANRVVPFYAQSGAGKTSLLNTQIIPALEEDGFNVLPVARVRGDVLPGIDPQQRQEHFCL
jgi:hypothetical protein